VEQDLLIQTSRNLESKFARSRAKELADADYLFCLENSLIRQSNFLFGEKNSLFR